MLSVNQMYKKLFSSIFIKRSEITISHAIISFDLFINLNLSLSILFRNCLKGEINQNDSCVDCLDNTYSIEVDARICIKCPD